MCPTTNRVYIANFIWHVHTYIHTHKCLHAFPFDRWFVHLPPVRLSVRPLFHLFILLSSHYLFINPSVIDPSIRLSIHLSIRLSIHSFLFVHTHSIPLYTYINTPRYIIYTKTYMRAKRKEKSQRERKGRKRVCVRERRGRWKKKKKEEKKKGMEESMCFYALYSFGKLWLLGFGTQNSKLECNFRAVSIIY